MSLHDVWELCFDFFRGKQISVEPVEENLSTDAGLLILSQFDEQQGLTAGFTEQLEDPRRKPDHSLLEMVRSRVFGILAGYEDQNDHDARRSDAVFKVLADRSPDDDDLASQPTLSRFENGITAKELLRLEEWFLERFVNSFVERPGVEYSIGLGMNQVLKRESEELLEQAVKQQESTGESQRLFTAFDYQASTWPSPRWVVVKCEANAKGTNRRAVVTNRPGARRCPKARTRNTRNAAKARTATRN